MYRLSLIALVLMVIFAVLRFVIPSQGLDLTTPTIFKDIAHVFVGGMLGIGTISLLIFYHTGKLEDQEDIEAFLDNLLIFCLVVGALGILLTIVEVIAALTK